MPEKESTKYWFPKKAAGFGWGWPVAWQGWLVFGLVTVVVVGGYFVFELPEQETQYALTVIAATAVLLAACFLKGEPLK